MVRSRKGAPAVPAAAEKIHKLLASTGLGSRREIEAWIAAGRIVVNGAPAHIGQRVTPTDTIEVDGKAVDLRQQPVPEVILLNKSAGIVCSRKDEEGRPTIFDGLPRLKRGRWVSIGRLDMQTTGLLLLTNDGTLANAMMHPSTGLDREYAVRVNGQLDEQALAQLTAGVEVDGELLRFSDIRYYDGTENNAWYHVVLTEGRNREVRRLFESLGYVVSRLKRVRYGPVILPSWLRLGQWAALQQDDVKTLYRLLRLPYAAPKFRKQRHTRLAKASCLLPYPKLNSG